ncbi:hypothetical protein IV500_21120 [Paeniglutamicibacter antarcticus]|uniref:DUF6318 domain-containing protein n=1 Tax=Arthrobacter terrae TaxID=2935737 RepID=A0A931G782_9MICC|nr:DUF6318 family protein [Arthrobacter terrae]MBG0741853.1 hypothetical protein [Arthrobacter terrae]
MTHGAATSSAAASPGITPSPTAAIPVYKPADATGPAQNVPLPVKPPLADEFSKAGIEAFARYWYDTLSYAYETADFAPLEAISDPGCATCSKVKERTTKWYDGGQWTAGGRMSVVDAGSPFAATPTGSYQVIVAVKQDKISYYRADGTLTDSHAASDSIADILVASYKQNRWTAETAEHISGKAE